MSSPEVARRHSWAQKSPRKPTLPINFRSIRKRYSYVPPAHKIVKSVLCLACIHPGGEVCILRRRNDGLEEWQPAGWVKPECAKALKEAMPQDVCTPVQLTEMEFKQFKEATERLATN